jgi:hypothetical protein
LHRRLAASRIDLPPLCDRTIDDLVKPLQCREKSLFCGSFQTLNLQLDWFIKQVNERLHSQHDLID